MGSQSGKHASHLDAAEQSAKSPNNRNEDKSPLNLTMDPPEENEVFAEADVNQNNGSPSKEKKVVVTDSKDDGEPKNAWKSPNTAEAAARPHLVRLFSRDAPGREDNTFKDRPSESEELQTIEEDSSVSLVSPDLMEAQKLASQTSTSSEKKGSVTKQMASASTSDHAKQAGGSHSRQRDSGLLDQLGKLFGQEGSKRVPEKGKDSLTKTVQAALTIHKPQPAPKPDDNAVVHFFKNVMSPKRAPPKVIILLRRQFISLIGADGQRPAGHGASGKMLDASKSKESFRGHKDGSGTLSKIFKLGEGFCL
uniref:Myelin basic protein n=1 Tax=Callorhinchus milii TaxID=7868 RepID=A0A4W3HPK1_CALMI